MYNIQRIRKIKNEEKSANTETDEPEKQETTPTVTTDSQEETNQMQPIIPFVHIGENRENSGTLARKRCPENQRLSGKILKNFRTLPHS
jgi:hypothetical protein